MAFLKDMSDRFWSYVSPRKTQQRRDKPFKVPTLLNKGKSPQRDVDEMTPHSRITQWKVRTPSSGGSIDGAQLPPSPPTSVQRQTDFDGDTLLYAETPTKSSFEEDEWDANEETLVVDDGEYMEQQKSINREKERMRREVQGRELREAGWTEDAVFLFQKLGLRGFEPLMPIHWINDFDSLPEDLFTVNESKAFIRSDSDSDFRAQLALCDLFGIGPRARDAVLTKAPIRTPEYHIRRTIHKYNRWAMKDGGMENTWNNLSLFDIVTCAKDVAPAVAEKRMIRKLEKKLGLWNAAFRMHADAPEPPTLYGVIASHTVMAFVSYVAPTGPNQSPSLRMIAMFDFGEDGYDVWNSLAIAIFVIHCRNRMRELGEFLPEPKVVRSRDPDL